jgi:hypothetical protein
VASEEELFAGVHYSPRGSYQDDKDAPGTLWLDWYWPEEETRERALIEVLQYLRSASGPRATELRSQVRSLSITTGRRMGRPFDFGWLTGLTALERVYVHSSTGLIGAAALAELPALRHVKLIAGALNET